MGLVEDGTEVAPVGEGGEPVVVAEAAIDAAVALEEPAVDSGAAEAEPSDDEFVAMPTPDSVAAAMFAEPEPVSRSGVKGLRLTARLARCWRC